MTPEQRKAILDAADTNKSLPWNRSILDALISLIEDVKGATAAPDTPPKAIFGLVGILPSDESPTDGQRQTMIEALEAALAQLRAPAAGP